MASSGNGNQVPNNGQGDQIPLRDLSRPPDTVIAEHTGRRLGRARSVDSDEGPGVRRYERIAEDSPSRERADSQDGFQNIDLSQDGAPSGRGAYTNNPRYSSASGEQRGAGLRFVPFEPISQTHSRLDSIGGGNTGGYGESDGLASLSNMEAEYFNENASPTEPGETDRTPLTDRRYLQPISGTSEGQTSLNKTLTGNSGHSVRFDDSVSGTRLGDDLPHLEGGLGRRHSSYESPASSRLSLGRSIRLTPTGSSSALSRAGSMMRMMSQRVVNLSNEPELVEQTLRRKSSLKTARLEGPPTLPAMADYAHDIRGSPAKTQHGPPEKPFPSIHVRQRTSQINPLRGKSLGIFSPENGLRKALCEVLIHPATEPIILILIVIQTVLLAVNRQ
ncbi:calcium channel subunit Cch1 [Coccidioides immitis H538.4]|uniref:Calcium channel subunit Cch1 n=1 Tax=Coccidioides immitis H538.4 TaxID=396776 RepID=A0A0J8UV28_COCIT|nr:calcium channel subunit Cch1 [Coccidioides immitis H538.4]